VNGADRHIFEFDRFRIDVEERRLFRDDSSVALASRDFDILLALVQNAGRTIGKNDLMETVWDNTFVEEGNLNRHVSTLRRLLGDHPREQRLIKTIPKRGYRFTAEVREFVETDQRIAVEATSRSRLVIREETTEGFWTTPRLLIAGIFVLVFGGIGWLGLSNSGFGVRGSNETRREEASDLYTRGRVLWKTRDANDLHNATRLLEQSVERDPAFALAHAALADAYAFDYANWTKAEAEAREAIRLDPSLGQPHATLGFVSMFWEWKLAEADEHFKKAISLSPEYATARHWYALNLAAASRGDAALVEIEKALSLEPDSIPINIDLCQILYFADRPQAADEQCERVLRMQPRSQAALGLLYQIASTRGQNDRAAEMFIASLTYSKSERLRLEAQKFSAAYSEGGFDGVRKAQKEFYTDVEHSPYKLARVLAESGDLEGAVESLKAAIERKDLDMLFFAADPAFAKVRISSQSRELLGRPN
jgi:DNA-binding winged helix-turn-helix (wHTH) protein/Tfp pilus assembly protein PilF